MTQRTYTIVGIVALVCILVLGAYALGLIHFKGFIPALGKGKPALNKELVFSQDFPLESREPYRARIEKARDELRAGADGLNTWLDLALDYRAIGDKESAAEIWEYLVSRYPDDYTPIRNLGEYYFHSVKDYDRAEGYYRRAIEVNPAMVLSYIELYEMYRYATLDKEKAIAILQEGISRVTEDQDIDLYLQLASYRRDDGEIAEARAAYTEARSLAQKLGNTALVRTIDQEVSRLK